MSEVLRLRADAVHWRRVEDEIVALDTRTSMYVGANPSATLLWEALTGGASRESLVGLLRERYGIDIEVAERDVDAFVADLRHRDLLG